MLELRNLSFSHGTQQKLEDITLSVKPGECVGLIGPNGAGKSTLLKAAIGLLSAKGVSSLTRLPPAQRAKAAAWLAQERETAWDISVIDTVRLARLPYGGQGEEAVEAALTRLDLQPLKERSLKSLSGGERARVLLARALAQDAPILLADEPTANLDPAAQILALETLQAEARAGKAVIVALHDLALAARYCTRLILIDAGRICADGFPEAVLTPTLLAQHFKLRATLGFANEGPILHTLGRI